MTLLCGSKHRCLPLKAGIQKVSEVYSLVPSTDFNESLTFVSLKIFFQSIFSHADGLFSPTTEPIVDDSPCASHGDFIPLGLST